MENIKIFDISSDIIKLKIYIINVNIDIRWQLECGMCEFKSHRWQNRNSLCCKEL